MSLDVTQAVLVRDYNYQGDQSSQRLALFDEDGKKVEFVVDPPTQAYVDEKVQEALARWSDLDKRMTFVSDISSPWEASDESLAMTPDGVTFGPYEDSSQGGGTLRFHGLDGQPLSVVKNFAAHMRYTTGSKVQALGSKIEQPYLRVFFEDDSGEPKSIIHNPGTQPYSGLGPGPFQEYVASSGTWRFDDDGQSGVPELSLDEQKAAHGDKLITKLTVTVGWTGGNYDLAGLLRWVQINGNRYTFGN